MYGETLGRWRSADLLIGLAFMARREVDERPVGDIAAQGLPFADGLHGHQRLEAQVCQQGVGFRAYAHHLEGH